MAIVNDEPNKQWGDSSKDVLEYNMECANCGGPCHTIVRDRTGEIFCSNKCKKEKGEEKG